jgi:ABC-type sugar transport system permease subunit
MLKRRLFVLAYLSPAVLLYGLFVGVPLIQTFYYSMFRWKGLSKKMTFVGPKNLVTVAQDEVMHKAAVNQLLLLVCGGLLLIGFSVAIAHALAQPTRLARTVQTVMLFPQVVSIVVVGIMWSFVFDARYGLVQSLGWPKLENGVKGTAGWANAAVLLVFCWHAIGFYVMLFGAGIKNIDNEILEAAQLDGSGGWHRFKHVTWPLLWSVKKVAVVYVVANVMGIFAIPKLVTKMGPDNATQSLLTLVYQHYDDSQMGQAATLAVYGFVVAMALGGLATLAIGRNPERSR